MNLNKLRIFLYFWSWININRCFYYILLLCLIFRQIDVFWGKTVGQSYFWKIIHKFIHRLRGQKFWQFWPRFVSPIRRTPNQPEHGHRHKNTQISVNLPAVLAMFCQLVSWHFYTNRID
jgi:hypothetical protein